MDHLFELRTSDYKFTDLGAALMCLPPSTFSA
jgi:hypothetical protein